MIPNPNWISNEKLLSLQQQVEPENLFRRKETPYRFFAFFVISALGTIGAFASTTIKEATPLCSAK